MRATWRGGGLLVVVGLVACGGGSSGGPDAGLLPDGGDCTPLLSCEARGAICGVVPDERCGAIDCGPCRLGVTSFDGDLPSLERDGSGGLHVVYFAFAETELRYAHLSAAGVSGVETIASTRLDTNGARPPAFVLDEAGTPHVAWQTFDGQVLYASRSGSVWNVETIGPGTVPDLALESDGTVHVVYGGPTLSQTVPLRHAVRRGTWTDAEIAPVVTSWPSLANAPDGSLRLAVAVSRDVYPSFELATWTGTAWTFAPLLTSPYFNAEPLIPELAIDAAGRASFVLLLAERLDLVSQVGGVWTQTTLVPDDVQATHAIVLDGAGVGHFVFFDRDGARYARTDGLASLALGDQCRGGGADIELGATGSPHIVLGCGKVRYLTPIGIYPPSYFAACDSVASRLCRFACDCRSGTDCAYASDAAGSGFSTLFGPPGICPGWVKDDLCNSNTVDPGLIAACDAALAASDGACAGETYVLPAACVSVLQSQ